MFEIVIVYYISNLCIAYFQHNNSSEDEMYEEDTTIQDFPPFMATFRNPKSDIAATDKKATKEEIQENLSKFQNFLHSNYSIYEAEVLFD